MRLRVVTLILSCSALAAVWACSLNPQPLPPDSYDAAADVSMTFGPDAAGGTDGNENGDTGVPLSGDASTDASNDASDASDATTDARDDDASLDAGEDG